MARKIQRLTYKIEITQHVDPLDPAEYVAHLQKEHGDDCVRVRSTRMQRVEAGGA